MSISIPRNATLEDEQMEVTASFSGTHEMPDGVESVSPYYIIETSKRVEFIKDVEVKLQHTAHLEKEEDYQNMVVLKASHTCSQGGHAGKFEEIDRTSVKFSPGFVMFKVKSFSWFNIGWRRKSREGECSLIRVYKSF